MRITTYIFGRQFYWEEPSWHAVDDPATVWGTRADWPCPKCGQYMTKDGHDPCIANLPGVKNACCGHGLGGAYIHFEDNQVWRGGEPEEDLEVKVLLDSFKGYK